MVLTILAMNAKNLTIMKQWLAERSFATNFLNSRGLLQDQVIQSKTYPTNSGQKPTGAENVLRLTVGMNKMKPRCAAALMAEISGGYLHPEAQKYMLHMLRHERYSVSSIGMGTPPGTIMHNKIGNAYDTLEEIAHLILPGGTEIVLAIYTNGYEPSEPSTNNLSWLTQQIIGNLPKSFYPQAFPVGVASAHQATTFGSGWKFENSLPDRYGANYLVHSGGPSAYAVFNIGQTIKTDAKSSTKVSGSDSQTSPSGELFEVSVFSPESSKFGQVSYTVVHKFGIDTINVDQRVNGGRMVKLGDFNLTPESIINVTSASNHPFVVDTVQAFPWPSCGQYIGTICPDWLKSL